MATLIFTIAAWAVVIGANVAGNYHIALAAAAVWAATMARDVPRAVWWVGAWSASFIISVTYLYAIPQGYTQGGTINDWNVPASVITGLCDAGIAIALWRLGKDPWEVTLRYLAIISASVSAMYATGELLRFPPIPPHDVYAILLDLINYSAALIIGGKGILKSTENSYGADIVSRIVGLPRVAGHAPRKKNTPSKTPRPR